MSVEISVSGSCNNAYHVVDPSPDTRASSKGLGSYIDATLKEKKKVKGLAIAFFAGDKRKIKFTVASDNKLVQTFASSGNTTAPEEFFFDKPITTQSLRVSFAGNYKKEVTFDKEALSTLPCGNPNFVDGIAVTTGDVKENKGIDDGSAGNDWFTVTRLAVIVDDSQPDVDLDDNNVVIAINDKTSTVKPDSNEPKKKDIDKTAANVDVNICGCKINVNNKNSFEERTHTEVAEANEDNKQERDTYKTTLDINTDNSSKQLASLVDNNNNNKQVTVKANSNNKKDNKQQSAAADSINKDNINKQEQATAKVDDKVNDNQDKPKAFQITGTPELKTIGTGSQSKVVINKKEDKTNI